MQAFKDSCTVLIRLSTTKGISFTDMRVELRKIEKQYQRLRSEKANVEYRFPSTEDTVLATKFKELIGEGLRRCKEVGLTYL